MMSSDSDSDSGSGSGSDSSSSDQPTFHKKVTFKKKRPQQQQQSTADSVEASSKLEDVAVSNINRNLKRLEQEQLHQNAQQSLVLDERILCGKVDDTDITNDPEEYQAWERRELDRLHRDRNRRISREERVL